MKEKAQLCKSHHAKQRLCVSVRGRPYITLVCMSVPACKASCRVSGCSESDANPDANEAFPYVPLKKNEPPRQLRCVTFLVLHHFLLSILERQVNTSSGPWRQEGKQLLLYSSLVQLWVILLIVSGVSHICPYCPTRHFTEGRFGVISVEMVLPESWTSDKVPGEGAFWQGQEEPEVKLRDGRNSFSLSCSALDTGTSFF